MQRTIRYNVELYKGRGSAYQQAIGRIKEFSPRNKGSTKVETYSNRIGKNSYVVKEDVIHLNVLNKRFRNLPQ